MTVQLCVARTAISRGRATSGGPVPLASGPVSRSGCRRMAGRVVEVCRISGLSGGEISQSQGPCAYANW